jgi:hypothetical protein
MRDCAHRWAKTLNDLALSSPQTTSAPPIRPRWNVIRFVEFVPSKM